MRIAAPPPRRSRAGVLVLAGVAVLAAAGGGAMLLRRSRTTGATTEHYSPPDVRNGELPEAFENASAIASLVSQVRGQSSGLARARTVMESIARELSQSGASRVTNVADVPRSRSIEMVWRAVQSRGGRVTELDLARLHVAVLRAAGTQAQLAERMRGPREDEPADPLLLGSFVVVVERHAIDVVAGLLVPESETRPRAMSARAITGAMLSQTALAEAFARNVEPAVRLANAAVDAWNDGVVPLVTRARVRQITAMEGGAAVAERDLSAAIALRNDASVYLLRARFRLASGTFSPRDITDITTVANERARAWGLAALAREIAGRAQSQGDAGVACARLEASRELWTDAAIALCRGTDPAGAVARLLDSAFDPIQLAFAASYGGDEALRRVREHERTEMAGWLLLLGRRDLAQRLMVRGDGG